MSIYYSRNHLKPNPARTHICCFHLKPQSHQAYDQATTYLRPKNVGIVGQSYKITYDWSQKSYDWSQRSWVIARGTSVAAMSWSCSKPSHTGLTTRLRPTCDRKMLESWANRRKNVRLVAEVARLIAEVVDDRKGQISRNKAMGMFKTCNLQFQIVSGRTSSRATGRATLRPVVPPIDCSLTL